MRLATTGTLLLWAVAVGAEPPTALQTFDPAKWRSGAEVRIEESAGGAALLGEARRGKPDATNPTNRLTFKSETGVQSVEATVTVLDASRRATDTSSPSLRIDGFFYRDGTGTGTDSDQSGHVQGDIRILVHGDQTLHASVFVAKCLDHDCVTFDDLFDAELGGVGFFEPHRLKIAFDVPTRQFRFQVDDQPATLFTAPDATPLPPTVPFMQIRARAGVPDGDATVGSMLALVDDVAVNGAPYDAFGARILPQASIVPGSGPFTDVFTSDVMVLVETAGEPVTDVKLFLDGQDVSGFLAGAIPGVVPGGGQTFRFPAVLLAGVLTPSTTALVGVEATTPSGVVAGYALWEVVP